ncbi:hypothetical protein BJX68DRAFT_241732 [Aspergillus pseudodeflectus]|uniref:Uncharacterized protein n=1 Tax=Aspergillus pseudodeflectus TaxID=176178 RepID=A0ABR4K0G4_9EURO
MDPDEVPPPPYSAVDPLIAQANRTRNAASSNANPSALHLRGGNAPLLASSAGGPSEVLPMHFSSAAAYFAERPAPVIEPAEQTLEHHITIYPRSQAKDFPRRPRCWSPRLENIAQQDWDMFLRHLFPPHLGLASSSAELPRQVRAEIRRDRKDRPQETDEERERRIATVMMEWNQYFFEPRAVRIVFFYVTDPRTAPASPLCPRCYPAATRASQENRSAQTPEAGRGQPLQPNMYPAATGYPQQPGYPGQMPSPYGYPNPAANAAPYLSPQTASGFFHPANPHVYQYPYQQYQQWGWNNQQYAQQYESPKGGPLGWFSNLAAQAQKYGERITEQAQQYGDQISAHASHYGRQVEEQAMAHGRWIEEQAGLGSRKVEGAFTGWNTPQQQGYYPYYYAQPATPNPTQQTVQAQPQQLQIQAQAQPETQTQTQPQPQTQPRTESQPDQSRSRRDSISSASSDSSLSSIDSISTTSELSSSDLATVRAQLLSLDDHHDRDLYDAAVELRRQLDALRESRRQARMHSRTTTTGRWRHGWGSHSQSRNDGQGRSSSWGRWESPQDRQRNQAERRAAKEELRATRKAFREVLRRARDEQKEQRRMKRNRRRQERRARWGQTNQREDQAASVSTSVAVTAPVAAPESTSLEQRLQNLELENNREASTQQRAAARAGSESSAVSSINTPSISSEEENDGPGNTARKEASKERK